MLINPQKVLLLGDVGVGKTSLAARLVHDTFSNSYLPTLGVDISTYVATLGSGDDVTLAIWDLDGDLSDSVFDSMHVRGLSGAVVVGDLTRRATHERMVWFSREFQARMPGRPLAFLFNKQDLAPDETFDIPAHLFPSGLEPMKTSAKTGQNVRAAFLGLATAIHRAGL
jgi:small GTP-binding protein